MFEARWNDSRTYCAFADTPKDAAESLRQLVSGAGNTYVYEWQSQQLVKVLTYR